MARRKILLNYPNIKTLRGHLVTFLPDKPKLKTAILELPYLSSGYSVVKIWHTNENVFTTTWEEGSISDSNGQNGTSTSTMRTVDYQPVVPGMYYAVTRNAYTKHYSQIRGYDKNYSFIGSGNSAMTQDPDYKVTNEIPFEQGQTEAVFYPTSGIFNWRFTNVAEGTSRDTSIHYMMVPGRSPNSNYVANITHSYTITFPSDFYGGSCNLLTGEAISTYASDGTALATPVSVAISSIQPALFNGINNIWTDCDGVITIEYWNRSNYNTIGGLPVLIDNALMSGSNNRWYWRTMPTTAYFITGWFDTGSNDTKSYTFPYQTNNGDSDGYYRMRFFNNPADLSVDYWGVNGSVGSNRTFSSAGRYIVTTVYKEQAADFFIYDNTNQRYVCKGKNVH